MVGGTGTRAKVERFKCSFCNKDFSREKTLFSHPCEQKRRYEDRQTKKVALGFTAFENIMKSIKPNTRPTSEEFRHHTLYLPCVKWAVFTLENKCFAPLSYLQWLLKMNVKIFQWVEMDVYRSWLYIGILEEDPWESFERSMITVENWAKKYNFTPNEYFTRNSDEAICEDILNSEVTGWLVLCSKSGQNWLSNLHETFLGKIWTWIDANRWSAKFKNCPDHFAQISSACDTLDM